MSVHWRIALVACVAAGLVGCSRDPDEAAETPIARAEPAAEPAPAAAVDAKADKPAKQWKEVDAPGAAKDAVTPFRSDRVDVVVQPQGAPGDKLEYKIQMKAGDVLTYAWTSEAAGDFWHEFHGHTGDTVAFYKKASGNAHAGTLVAPFEGIHGWYFENRSPDVVVVRLALGGFYALVPDDES